MITKRKIPTVVPLSYPLPTRDWQQLPNGLWASVEWTTKTKEVAEQARRKVVFQ